MKRIAIVLLAAGNSTRYHGIKLLDMVNGKKMYQYILEGSSGLNANPKIIVTQYDEIRERASEYGFIAVKNSRPELGISHSLQLGLKKAMKQEPELDGVLFSVCDQPYIKRATLKRLAAAFLNSPKNMAGVSYEGELGNPCIIGSKYFNDLYALKGDVGGKRVMLRHPEDVEKVPVLDGQELQDIDYRVTE